MTPKEIKAASVETLTARIEQIANGANGICNLAEWAVLQAELAERRAYRFVGFLETYQPSVGIYDGQ